MGNRRLKLGSRGLERVLFLALLLGVAVAVGVSTQVMEDTPAVPAELPRTEPAPRLRSGPLTAVVSQSTVVPATTDAGRRRDRVRVAVAVTLSSSSERSVSIRRVLRLEYSGRSLRPDLAASDPGLLDLRRAIPAGGTRRGEVRFELSGRDTQVLRDRGDARLVLVAPRGSRSGLTMELDVPA